MRSTPIKLNLLCCWLDVFFSKFNTLLSYDMSQIIYDLRFGYMTKFFVADTAEGLYNNSSN